MRAFIIALLWLPLVSFAQDSLNVTKLSEINLTMWPELSNCGLGNTYLFAPELMRGLHIVDVCDPENPFEAGFLQSEHMLYDVALWRDHAYVTDYEHGIRIVDVSDVASPVEVALYDGVIGLHIKIEGMFAYVWSIDAIDILNLSNPVTPVRVGTYRISGPPQDVIRDFAPANGLLYVTTGRGYLRIIDVSDATSLEEIGSVQLSDAINKISVTGNRAYISSLYDGQTIVDVSDPTLPQQVGTFSELDNVTMDIAAQGEFVFLADKQRGLRVVNVSNPAAPNLVGYYRPTWYSYQVEISGNFAYINDAFGVAIFDVSQALPVEHRGGEIVDEFALSVFPNPFNSTATISFDLPREMTGRLVVYDVLGRVASTLFDGRLSAGSYSKQFDGNNLSSGTYFVKLETPDFNSVQKTVLLK